jgi:hypothetical protein
MPNSKHLDDAAFPQSPMMKRIERNQRSSPAKRIAGIAVLVAGAAIAVLSTVGPQIMRLLVENNLTAGVGDASRDASSGPCAPGDLDCLDDRFDEEHGFPFSPGTPDGCILLSEFEQLESPLCCPHVASDPSACPPLENAADAGSQSSEPTDGEPLPGGVETPEEGIEKPEPEPTKPAPPRSTDPFEDFGVELPG